MKKNTYFSMIFKKALPETGIKSKLERILKIKKEDSLNKIVKEFHTYLKGFSFDEHFEIICNKIELKSNQELYLKKLANLYDIGIKAIKDDFSSYRLVYEEKKKREKDKAFSLLLEKKFNLEFAPYIPRVYKEDHGFLTFETDKESIKLCNMFVPRSIIVTETNGKSKSYLKLSIHHHKRKHIEIIESFRDLNKSDRLSNTFGDNGLYVDNAKASKITTFIAEYISNNTYEIKEEKGKLQTGWDNGVFYIPQREQEVVWLEPNLKNAYKQNGTYDKQLELLNELSKGKVFLTTLGAFAAPLFGILDIDNFFIHIGGITRGGKSLAVKSALSFFGNPKKMGNNFNATLNGLETYWEQNHSLPMWIDEMEVARRIEDVTDAIYEFFDGRGKVRAYSKDDEIRQRETKSFKGICFTTGEKSLIEVQNSVREGNKKRGITGRAFDINIKGLWDNVNLEKIKDIIDFNYGILGIEYIEYIEQNFKSIRDDYINQCSFFKGIADGDKQKQFGLLKLALEILFRMNKIDKYNYEMQIVNLKQFAEQEQSNMDNIQDTYTEFKEAYTEFILSNREHFDFVSSWSVEDENVHTKTPFYGKVDLGNNTISVFKNEFKRWCMEHHFVIGQVLESLEDNKNLSYSSKRKYKDKQIKFNGKPLWCYQFEKLFEDDIEIIYENLKPKMEDENTDIEEEPKTDEQKESLFDAPVQNQHKKIELNTDEINEDEIPF